MGEIFLAHFSGLGGFQKVVVIKRLLAHLAEDEHFVAMFLDEARIAAQLSHPNVCQVYDIGQVDGQYFIAMEYLEGVTFSRMIRSVGNDLLDIGLTLCLVQQACEGLHHAHDLKNNKGEFANVVHRDVSPSNLFITSNGVLKVLDFGIAKAQGATAHTRTGTLKGKYAYMSPEQLLGKPLDRRSDIFALGIVLFEALTGRRLFHRESDFLIFRAITEEPIPQVKDYRPDVSSELSDVVTRSLARETSERFATIREFGEALTRISLSLGTPFTSMAVGEYLRKNYHDRLEERRLLVESADLGDATRTSHQIDPKDLEAARRVSAARENVETHPGGKESPSQMPTRALRFEPYAQPTKRFPWLLVLMGVGLVGAVGLAAYAHFSTPTVVPPPVIPPIFLEQGGVKMSHDGGVQSASQKDANIAANTDAATATKDAATTQTTPPIDAQQRNPRTETAEQKRKRLERERKRRSREIAQKYSRVVRKQSKKIAACIREQAVNITGAPKFSLVLVVNPNGSVQSVQINPASFRTTTVGSCIRSIILSQSFPKSTDPVKVTIPLGISLSR